MSDPACCNPPLPLCPDDQDAPGDTVQERIAYRIRAELVCCDIYARTANTSDAGREHAICFWGEAAARIAEATR
ncbi:MAG TPA: hypothetical protein VI172_08175 [Candidatus Dormibacteraeota bacterium]|jgi:hypothetical protein